MMILTIEQISFQFKAFLSSIFYRKFSDSEKWFSEKEDRCLQWVYEISQETLFDKLNEVDDPWKKISEQAWILNDRTVLDCEE